VLDRLGLLIIYGEVNDAAGTQSAPAGLEALPRREMPRHGNPPICLRAPLRRPRFFGGAKLGVSDAPG
jgi:hypothetical protein